MAQEGWPRVTLLFGLTLGLLVLAKIVGKNPVGHWLNWAARTLGVGGLLTAYAYRNPSREPLGQALDFFYAPVDGRVHSIEQVNHAPTFLNDPAQRIQFSSQLLDVPIIRAPFAGQVRFIYQQPNEPVRIGLESLEGQSILLEFQSSGLVGLNLPAPLADSEVLFLHIEVGESVTPSQPLAVRGFGTSLLTTLYYPADTNTILIKTGWPTQAGMTAVGRVITEKYRN